MLTFKRAIFYIISLMIILGYHSANAFVVPKEQNIAPIPHPNPIHDEPSNETYALIDKVMIDVKKASTASEFMMAGSKAHINILRDYCTSKNPESEYTINSSLNRLKVRYKNALNEFFLVNEYADLSINNSERVKIFEYFRQGFVWQYASMYENSHDESYVNCSKLPEKIASIQDDELIRSIDSDYHDILSILMNL